MGDVDLEQSPQKIDASSPNAAGGPFLQQQAKGRPLLFCRGGREARENGPNRPKSYQTLTEVFSCRSDCLTSEP